MTAEQSELEAMLVRLRTLRSGHEWGEIRQAYNAACDRLDVLCDRVRRQDARPLFTFRGFWSRVWGR